MVSYIADDVRYSSDHTVKVWLNCCAGESLGRTLGIRVAASSFAGERESLAPAIHSLKVCL